MCTYILFNTIGAVLLARQAGFHGRTRYIKWLESASLQTTRPDALNIHRFSSFKMLLAWLHLTGVQNGTAGLATNSGFGGVQVGRCGVQATAPVRKTAAACM